MTPPHPTTVDTPHAGSEWWRSAVIYQVYPRSFADASGDGVGDLRGVLDHLDDIASLGVDAIWLSPFYPSPQNDAGYDVADYTDVDPLFGSLGDVDELIAAAHARGMRIIVDVVPNHSSNEHPWFRDALAAEPGSRERGRYIFRDGRGPDGDEPPNNWQSLFGGSAWTRTPDGGQWYLHLFDETQPDFDWESDDVTSFFDDVLRFWLDRGVDGFRVDMAHGNVKEPGLPDIDPALIDAGSMESPYLGHEGVHRIFRRWRTILDTYPGDRMMCGEAWVRPLEKLARFTRPDEMHQAFNFVFLQTEWNARELRASIDASRDAFGAVGAPTTWVLSNHDTIRHATRLALVPPPARGQAVGPGSASRADPDVAFRRGRAASMLMLALPGSAYVYQGDELGLPEFVEMSPAARRDPQFLRTGGAQIGRDGARVPMPWAADRGAYGFSESGRAWLPQPDSYRELAWDRQDGSAGSTLELHRAALRLRREFALGAGDLNWHDAGDRVLTFENGGVEVVVNLGGSAVPVPPGEVLLATDEIRDGALPADAAAWIRAEH